jgi:hypothetical protein
MPHLPIPEQVSFDEECKRAYQRAYEKGYREGCRQGILSCMPLVLELKFGTEGLTILPTLEQQSDVATLVAVLESVRTATSVDDLRRLCG